MDFHESWYPSIFRKSVEKVQVLFKSDTNNGYITRRLIPFLSYLAQFLKCEIFQTKVIEKIKTHFFFSNVFKNCVYEIMWKNTEEPGRPQITMRRMRIVCCVPKATYPLIKYVKLIAFPLQQWLHKRTSFLRYTYIACLLNNRYLWGQATHYEEPHFDLFSYVFCLKCKSKLLGHNDGVL